MTAYQPDACCGDDCYAHNLANAGPCWGDVEVVDEVEDGDSHAWVHACRGHEPVYNGGAYEPDPSPTASGGAS